jgi:hypothetical protein
MVYQTIDPRVRGMAPPIPPPMPNVRPQTPRAHNRQMFLTMIGGGLILLLVGLGLIGTAALYASKQAQLREEGKTIIADVIDAQVTKTSTRGTVTSTRYEVKYRVQVAGQAAITSDWQKARKRPSGWPL